MIGFVALIKHHRDFNCFDDLVQESFIIGYPIINSIIKLVFHMIQRIFIQISFIKLVFHLI